MIYPAIIHKHRVKKQVAVLIDPDKADEKEIFSIIQIAAASGVDFIFVGGSLMVSNHLDNTIQLIKESCNIPVILFPGSPMQLSAHADAILLLSLISGRNPELLIGHHVLAASQLKKSGIEVIPTGYMLIDGGKPTSASYISASSPIPADKEDIASSTAIAGELLGMKFIYLDAGSGAMNPVPFEMIKQVKHNIDIPLIVGGGIDTKEKAVAACRGGADVIVIGNAVEKDPSFILEISVAVKSETNEAIGNFQSR